MGRFTLWCLPSVCLLCWVSLLTASPLSHKEKRGAGGGGGGSGASFTETEEGQVAVVTSHGVPVSQTSHTQKGQEEITGEFETEMDTDEDTGDHPLRRRRSVEETRMKRFMTSDDQYVWPKGIVPYDFDMNATGVYYRDEALAAMTRFHKYTCVRFVPWVKGQTMEKYKLSEESHVTITRGDGCKASQGNRHSGSGQYNSCCSRGYCTHELGHSLGLWHEHQSPWRQDFLALNKDNVPGDKQWTYRMRFPHGKDIYQYDTTNTMHYGGSAFEILYEDLKPLIAMPGGSRFYMYKDISLYHDCRGLHCASFTTLCHNDGYVTLVDDQCSCLCPPGLDPATGCAATVRQADTGSIWPAGSFALLSSTSGCPGNEVFEEGAWQHKGKGDNGKSDVFHLAGSFQDDVFRYQFCVREDNSARSSETPGWEPGRYCVLRVGRVCPSGFKAGSIQFDDAPDSTGRGEGRLPDGHFTDNEDTRLDFCCRDDGFTDTPLAFLPNSQPFVLLMNQESGECQEVLGMRWTEEYMWFDGYAERANVSGSHPYVTKDTTFKVWFCHYVPVNFNCGGETTLTKNNPEAVITSPNFPAAYGPDMECNWLIKAGERGGQVLLNFDVMKVTSKGDDCADSLEIRYNMPGQPGIRYCGDGMARTIRSLNDTVMLTLRSDQDHVTTDVGFRVTASLYLPEQEGCYELSTRGRLYRGQKNYTRGMKTCMAWTQVPDCDYHAFHPRDVGVGLDENYCRNPDNTAMPWCYTDTDCSRDYCDVCNIERLYDTFARCSNTVCQRSAQDVFKAGCAATCRLQQPQAPRKDTVCGEPGAPADARLGPRSAPEGRGHALGETVTLQCATGPEQLNITCLDDGHWSPAGYVCGACAVEWADYNGHCYKYFSEPKTFWDAQQTCSDHGASLTTVRDKEEQTFVGSLRVLLTSLWIGITDREVEGEYRWLDGTPVQWFNWNSDNTPNNYNNQDCVEMYTDYYNLTWNDLDCDEVAPFVCKYQLSERKLCVDRHRDCRSVLLTVPETCSQHPAFVRHMCPYSCGLCQSDDSRQCQVPTGSDDVTVLRPQGQRSVPRGAVVQLACREGFDLTDGQLTLACGQDGQWIGTLPVCEDPDTLVQDSNAVELLPRPRTTASRYAYTSRGASLAVRRSGVIKQWKFFSPSTGFSFFHVWRPSPGGGDFRLHLVGQSQVLTSGQGEETYSLQEADWITVQPGDRIGLYEMESFRGYVPYTECDENEQPEDSGVMWGEDSKSYGDFSPSLTYSFSSDISCRRFSFKAVIHPLTSVPPRPDRPTSKVALVSRSSVGAAQCVYLGDSSNFYIPADGYVKEWQFFSKHAGTGAFQVWRRRQDLGVRKYQLVGQNEVNITYIQAQAHTLVVEGRERIAVKAGDIIAFLYGTKKLGVPYSLCSEESYPEGNNIYWYETLTPDTAFLDDVFQFDFTSAYMCRVFSFRAIIQQADVVIREPDPRTSDILLVSRSSVGAAQCVYLGDSSNFYIPADGYVKEWQFFSKHAGTGAFQVWRRRQDLGVRNYELIGQNAVNITSNEARPHKFPVKEGERIAVRQGDIIGFLYGENKLGVPYSFCGEEETSSSNNIYWYETLTPDTAVVGKVYAFDYTGGSYLCRVFSFRAVIQQEADEGR